MTISQKEIEVDGFGEEITVNRIIANVKGKNESPTVVFFGGIHGNEKAGVIALNNVTKKINNNLIPLNGNFYAISGNLNALKKGVRYDTVDLNRVWTEGNIKHIKTSANGFSPDISEQIGIYNTIKTITSENKGPFYFIDLHTTSADSVPFITISDSLDNRKFSSHFSIPTILGIEEYLEGPLLTYINEFGHTSLGFEGGQHDAEIAVTNCEAFIWLSLVITKCITKNVVDGYERYRDQLNMVGSDQGFYEIKFRYQIDKNEDFYMIEGFKNFQDIKKNEALAYSNSQKIKSMFNGKIFMPLYQNKGDDGFFIIGKVSKFWLSLSKIFRKLKLHHVLRLLPGIQQDRFDKHILIVDPKTARFLASKIFHLFGYRKKVKKDKKWYFIKRDRAVSEFN